MIEILFYKNKYILPFISIYGIIILYLLYISNMIPSYIKIVLKLFIILFFLFLFILEIKKNNDVFLFIMYFLFSLLRICICIINKNVDNNLVGLLYNDMLIIFTLIIIVYLNSKYHLDIFLKLIIICFFIFFIYGIIGQFIGGYEFIISVYSNTNEIYFFNIILLIAISLYFLYHSKNINFYIFYIIISVLMVFQATLYNSKASLISFLIIILSTLFMDYLKINILLLKPVYSILYNIFIWCILMLDVLFASFTNLIAVILGKSTDFSGRRNLWKAGLKAIMTSPFGFRNFTEKSILNDYNNSFHNFYIEILYTSGVIGFLFFLFFLLYITINLDKVKNGRLRFASFYMIFAILLRFQMESYWINCMFFSLSLIYFLIKYYEKSIKMI